MRIAIVCKLPGVLVALVRYNVYQLNFFVVLSLCAATLSNSIHIYVYTCLHTHF